MILNNELEWAQVGAIETSDENTQGEKVTQYVRDAFQLAYGEPSKDILDVGVKLYKFNSFKSFTRDDTTLTSSTLMRPWWTASEPYKHDGGLVQRLKLAEANGVSARELGRLTSVIREDWNSCAHILEIVLDCKVYGWFGGFKGMPRIGKGKSSMRKDQIEKSSGSSLPGGGTQFYIPNLTYGCIRSHRFIDL